MQFVPIAIAVLSGALYGLFGRWVFHNSSFQAIWMLMSMAFMCVVPGCLGALTVRLASRSFPLGLAGRIFLPWVPTIAVLAGSFVAHWEGLICIVLMSPLGLLCSSIGGLLAGLSSRRNQGASITMILVLPYLVAPVERLLPVRPEVRSVHTTIEIEAERARVWELIARVRPIGENELRTTWIHRIGFPKPVEAVLAREGVGAFRKATFRGGIEFTETVTEWDPERTLAFSIQADTRSIPASTLDGHVTIGGAYFDVLRGEYRIENVSPGRVLLHLTSWHRVSTTFNWYASLWSDAIMADIQRTIIEVIKRRSEASTIGGSAFPAKKAA